MDLRFFWVPRAALRLPWADVSTAVGRKRLARARFTLSHKRKDVGNALGQVAILVWRGVLGRAKKSRLPQSINHVTNPPGSACNTNHTTTATSAAPVVHAREVN